MQVRSFIPALLVVAAIGTAAQASRGKDSRAAEYARLLAGKTAERPVDCIDTRFTRPSLTAYGDKLVYKVSNKLVYVSDTAGGCQAVARGVGAQQRGVVAQHEQRRLEELGEWNEGEERGTGKGGIMHTPDRIKHRE